MSDRLTEAELSELALRAQTASVLYPFSCRFDVARRLLAEVRELRAEVAKGTGDVMCGHADEGWEEFPCTRPKGHDGDHETHLRLDPAPDKGKDHE